jgi:hypothetical protein
MSNDNQLNEQGDGLESEQMENALSKNQKWAISGLTVFAILIVILWFAQLKNSIYAPLNSGTVQMAESDQLDSQTARDLALKNKDTDADGLSDYDELNIHKTSPYLEDSDSDGIKDGEEIKKNTDPNCPQGRTCSSGSPAPAALPGAAASGQTLDNLLNQSNAANSAPKAGAVDLNAEQKQILKNIDAATLRQMLLEAGMDKATLDQISDTELMQSYNETLQ